MGIALIRTVPVWAEVPLDCSPLSGENVHYQNYAAWSQPVYSYLTTSGSGYMRVQGNVGDTGVVAVYYNSDFSLSSRKVIPQELPVFGGFFESDSHYYLVTGQNNGSQSSSTEVFRVTKYDKSWNRLGSCGLYGANTVKPFHAGSCRMAMDGNHLLIRTCHTMYKSSDGYNHQANVTIQVDTSAMEVEDAHYEVANIGTGYVSHSFNQFIGIDNHRIVAVDHGDAYPRSIVLTNYSADVTTGTFLGSYYNSVQDTTVLNIQGSIGDNYTGASVGGLQINDGYYLVAGNSVEQNANFRSNRTRNVFVAAVNKNSKAVSMHWITNYAEGEASGTTPHLVPVDGGRYMVLWERADAEKVYYTFVGADGQSRSGIYSMEGALSDCVPLVSGNRVIWYTWEDGTEIFYSIPVSSPGTPSKKALFLSHDYERISTKNGHVSLRCRKCGTTSTGKAPVGFTIWWRMHGTDSYYGNNVPGGLEAGDALEFMLNLYYSDDSDETVYDEMEGTSSDPENCIIDMKNQIITFRKADTYTVTIYPKYNPEAKKEIIIRIVKPLESVSLSAAGASQTYGTPVPLTAVAEGGKGTLQYRFVQIDSEGKETVIQDDSEAECNWEPAAIGSYKLRVDVTDPGDDNKKVQSDEILIKITKRKLNPEISLSASTFVYTGKAIKPAVTVTDGGRTLINKTDYKVTYKNNKAAGKATVIITGRGNYTGTATKDFAIKPAKTNFTAAKNTSKQTVTLKWTKTKSGTGYEVQYSLKKNFKSAKKVEISKGKTVSTKVKKLKKGKTYYFRVRVYKDITSKKLYSAWSDTAKVKISR